MFSTQKTIPCSPELNFTVRTLEFQYQYALVRVLTHFVAEPSDPGGEMVFMLGADWQADITHLVLDQLKVRDESVIGFFLSFKSTKTESKI